MTTLEEIAGEVGDDSKQCGRLLVRDFEQLDVSSAGRSRARAVGEVTHLADRLARPRGAERDLLAVLGPAVHHHPPGGDDVHRVAGGVLRR